MRSESVQFDIDLAYILCQSGCVRLFNRADGNDNAEVIVRTWAGRVFTMNYPTSLDDFRADLGTHLEFLNATTI
jgi:hypothetical protein